MTRRLAFRECDLKRAVKVAQALNAGPVRIDPRTGDITIEPKPDEKSSPQSPLFRDGERERIRL